MAAVVHALDHADPLFRRWASGDRQPSSPNGLCAAVSLVAAIYSIIESCRFNGVEPRAYITEVMRKFTAVRPNSPIDELMPWAWAKS
ncbi:transposase domain-containing protein [Beijerinckia mobilis]|uniref:transposase domain-containing protein n=1 Tax=Beijerinckia mobilis TaxID=231434 RepID=UPI00069128B8